MLSDFIAFSNSSTRSADSGKIRHTGSSRNFYFASFVEYLTTYKPSTDCSVNQRSPLQVFFPALHGPLCFNKYKYLYPLSCSCCASLSPSPCTVSLILYLIVSFNGTYSNFFSFFKHVKAVYNWLSFSTTLSPFISVIHLGLVAMKYNKNKKQQ